MIGYARACIVIWYGVVKLRLTMVLLGNRDNYLLLAICLPDIGGGGGGILQIILILRGPLHSLLNENHFIKNKFRILFNIKIYNSTTVKDCQSKELSGC